MAAGNGALVEGFLCCNLPCNAFCLPASWQRRHALKVGKILAQLVKLNSYHIGFIMKERVALKVGINLPSKSVKKQKIIDFLRI